MELAFEKYEGIGNDFIVCRVDHPGALPVELAQKLCDRHFGIGADGVLLLTAPDDRLSRGRMTVINADGSRPEMCGNGLRCAALALLGPDEVQAEFLVETDAGPRGCQVDRNGAEALVTTHLGRGELLGRIQHEHDGAQLTFTRISMGNPHAVTFAPQLPELQLDVLGPALSGRIPQGVNVEIATMVGPGHIDLSVWERGVGRTLACGTGAAATAVAAVSLGHAPANVPLAIHLPGGPLQLTVTETLDVTLRGPARFVFRGSVPR